MKATPAQILARKKNNGKRYAKSTLSKAASQLGRAGGLIGGPARANALTMNQTMTIARHAAYMRWYDECPVRCKYCGNEKYFVRVRL